MLYPSQGGTFYLKFYFLNHPLDLQFVETSLFFPQFWWRISQSGNPTDITPSNYTLKTVISIDI